MKIRLRFHVLGISLVAALAMIACSDDDSPTGGGTTDTTPPGVASVTASDANHVVVVYNEGVTRTTAEDTDNYTIIYTGPIPVARGANAAGGAVDVASASLKSDGKTVTLSTSLMTAGSYALTIHGVQDLHGNTISETGLDKPFAGSGDADNTAPEITRRVPAPSATGVSVAAPLEIDFSEAMDFASVQNGLTLSSVGGDVLVSLESFDLTHYVVTHEALDNNVTYTVDVSGVTDASANALPVASWTFKTTNVTDTTPPTLVSSVPAKNAVNVDVNSNLSLTFSEAIDQNTFSPLLIPDMAGVVTWSNGGKTVTLDPTDPLWTDQQFTLQIFPGDMADLAGNVNTAGYNVVFSTGAALEAGSIGGTITGDPNSDSASDPTGALVGAATVFPFAGDDVTVFGITTVAANNTYNIQHLADDVYFPLTILNSNHDGVVDPFLGDALGLYGIDLAALDTEPDSVEVVKGSHLTGINFKMYDPTSVYGTVSYDGVHVAENHNIYVALFDVAGFDPNTSVPVVATSAFWPDGAGYVINSIEVGPIPDGNYYLGAFIDANDSGDFEPISDPAGLYGGSPPTAINLLNGSDASNRNIVCEDPVPGVNATTTHWAARKHSAWLRGLSQAVREAQVSQK